MQARCPHCQLVFSAPAPGIQSCPGCGQQINVPAPPGGAPISPGALCARHPERAATGTCARCGNFTCDECSLGRTSLCPACRATQGAAGPIQREPTPWERRGELGLVQALWLTWKRTCFEPEKFWSSVEPTGSMSDALFYAWVLTVIGAVPSALMNLLNFKSLQAQLGQAMSQLNDLPPEVTRWISAISENSAAFAVGLVLGTVLLYPVSLLLSAGLTHLGCLLFGAGKNGFGATFRVLAYASAPAVLAWIPMVGAAAAIYLLVLEVWGILRVQETTTGRAIGGILAIPLLIGCCACGLGIAAVSAALGSR